VRGEGTSDEALAGAGRPDEDDVVVLLHPAAGGELADDGLVELTPRRVVDRFETGVGQLQLGLLEGTGDALVVAGEPLGIDEQAEALVEAQARQRGVLLLLGPGVGHGVELEGLQLVQGRGGQHGGDVLLHR
jgi:hypothetical protein